jgi:hypothetical protein
MTDIPPHIRLIRALDGDENSGMALCPSHDDNRPSLSIAAGHTRSIILKCFAGCTYEQITDRLRLMGRWPVPGADTPYVRSGDEPKVRYSAEERRRYALRILEDTRGNRGQELAPFLKDYFRGRGITSVPPTALLALCHRMNSDEGYLPDCPAMIFPIVDHHRTLGCHVTWLNTSLTAKVDEEPQRKTYGPVRGGYIELYAGTHDPAQRLIIGEGVETALSAAQLAGLPAIAAISAKNMPLITPPPDRAR